MHTPHSSAPQAFPHHTFAARSGTEAAHESLAGPGSTASHPARPEAEAPSSTPSGAARSDPQIPTVIRCETTADFLASLPRLVGFTAPDSLFVVLFSESRAHGAMRVDLPDGESPEAVDAYIAELIGWVAHAEHQHGTSRPAFVITSSLSFSEAGEIPWRRFAGRLDAQLERAGISPRELCCLAPDGWASYLDLGAPLTGYPLNLIDRSAAAPDSPLPTLAELGQQRRVRPTERDAFAGALERERAKRAHPSFGHTLTAAADWHALGDRQAARLRDRLEVLFSPGKRTLEECASLVSDLTTDAGWTCCFDSLATAASTAHDPAAARDPDRAALSRLVAASDTLAFIAPLVSRSERAAFTALCALAWWFRGLESVATAHIAEALRLDSADAVVQLAGEVIHSGSFTLTTRGLD